MGQKCVHCGEDCGKDPVMWDDKHFCCYGCKTVYQILNEKKLGIPYVSPPQKMLKPHENLKIRPPSKAIFDTTMEMYLK